MHQQLATRHSSVTTQRGIIALAPGGLPPSRPRRIKIRRWAGAAFHVPAPSRRPRPSHGPRRSAGRRPAPEPRASWHLSATARARDLFPPIPYGAIRAAPSKNKAFPSAEESGRKPRGEQGTLRTYARLRTGTEASNRWGAAAPCPAGWCCHQAIYIGVPGAPEDTTQRLLAFNGPHDRA